MSRELTALLLKALRSLSPEEQDKVVSELLSARLDPPPVTVTSGFPLQHMAVAQGPQMVALRESLARETAGPWQTVPVRLPVELHERLKQWCQANNFTMAVVLRGLAARFLDEFGAPDAPPKRDRPEAG
jgi:hypothetical protein